MSLLLTLSYAKFDYVVRDKYGLKYIIYFSKAYVCICSILLSAIRLYYKIFMHLDHISVIFICCLLDTFQ